MRISRQQLRRIIREMHPRAAADDAYVADLERQEDELATQIRHASKDVHGRKDIYDLEGKSIEELEDLLYDLGNSPEQRDIDDMYRDREEDAMGRDQDLSPEEMSPRRLGMGRRTEGKVRITKKQLRLIIKEELGREMKQDLSVPIPIDDLLFIDEEGYGAMMFPGMGHSYSVREKDFEDEKIKLKQKYGEDVKISTPDPRYPKVKKLHSAKASSADKFERQNFIRHQAMMQKRTGRKPGLGS